MIRLKDCRDEVKMFAMAMEAKLRENDTKKGWKVVSFQYLYGSTYQELIELGRAWSDLQSDPTDPKLQKILFKECVDVANFVMMIADNAGLLTIYEEKKGELQ